MSSYMHSPSLSSAIDPFESRRFHSPPQTYLNSFQVTPVRSGVNEHGIRQTFLPQHYSVPQRASMMVAPNTEEMEEMQRLSDKYQPSLEGPLVGDKLPMTDLVTEYAQADPRFVAKTHALANRYIAYRRIKGDGQCGWRGAVFGYFETMLKSRDHGFAVQEYTRIKSFEDTMRMAGIDYDILEPFFDETWTLFQSILQSFEQSQVDDTIITNVFNDENRSNGIIYHFKMMTSSFMALHPDDFEPFLEMSLDQYRQTRIDPTLQEIDQIGLQALTTGVIAPANVALEVLYLDRSAGDEVTPHEFVPDATAKPTIRLLYRPGHYDLIYKHDETYTVLATDNFATDVHLPAQAYMQEDLSFNMFPMLTHMDGGMSAYPQMSPSTSYPHQPNTYMHQNFNTDPIMYMPEPYDMPSRHQPNVIQAEYPLQPSQTSSFYQSSPEAYSNPTSPPPPPVTLPQTTFSAPTASSLPIRFSSEMMSNRRGKGKQQPSMPLDSTQWGASREHPAHFSHQNFTPEIYGPQQG